ncbi:hypothetical protein [Domibacillus tundrae]|uniref:hypothetical protein n=1 Tax=Domibacillus tundrae TaxID=1587527 RepID=UPI00339A3508
MIIRNMFLAAVLFLGGCSEEAVDQVIEEEDQALDELKEEPQEDGDWYVEQLAGQYGELIPDESALEEETAEAPESPPEETAVITYSVENGEIMEETNRSGDAYADNWEDQERLWSHFYHMMPADYIDTVGELEFFTDGSDETLAYVEPMDDTYYWKVAIDFQDTDNEIELYGTLLHEIAHIVTLADDQFTDMEEACATYESDYGCMAEESYMNQFFQTFWAGPMYVEWAAEKVSEDVEAQDAFYDKYTDQFLTYYATTYPDEDLAESWVYFLFSTADEVEMYEGVLKKKILFFYDFPELVEMREEMLANMWNTL